MPIRLPTQGMSGRRGIAKPLHFTTIIRRLRGLLAHLKGNDFSTAGEDRALAEAIFLLSVLSETNLAPVIAFVEKVSRMKIGTDRDSVRLGETILEARKVLAKGGDHGTR